MKTALFTPAFAAFVFAALLAQPGRGQLYYDTNGSTAGTSTSSTQNFTDTVWTLDPLGLSTTIGYLPNSTVTFSADALGTGVGTGAQNVTFTDAESVDGFTFNNGTVTLFGSGSPSLSIGLGGITNNSTDGATTFDSSLGTVTASASQTWTNDTTQALNFNAGLTSSGSTITFAGTGSGNVIINGALSGSVNLDATSTTSTVELTNNSNNFGGTITADGGSVLITNSLPNSNPITLENNGMIEMDNTQNFNAWNNNITLGVGGGRFYAGNAAGSGIDLVYGGVITGGTGLTFEGGDLLPSSNTASDIGTLNIAGGRLLAIGTGFFGNNAIVNVSNGAILDFGIGGTLANQITLASGSALENRGPGITLTDVILPTGNATVTLGADDTTDGRSITLNGPAVALAGNTLTLIVRGNESYPEYTPTDADPTDPANNNSIFNTSVAQTPIHLEQQITGSGNLVITPEEAPIINTTTHDLVGYRLGYGSPIYLDGANNYSGTTTVDGAIVYVGASGFGTSSVTLNSGSGAPYYDNASQLELSGGTFANSVTVNSGLNVINLLGGSPNENITGPIDVAGSNVTLVMANSSSSNLSLGNIHFDAAPYPDHTVNLEDYGSGQIVMTGTYASDYVANGTGMAASYFLFGYGGENGTYVLAPTSDFTGMQNINVNGRAALELWSGTLDIETDAFSGQTISIQGSSALTHVVNLVGARTLNAGFYVNAYDGTNLYSWTLAQTTADQSTTTGSLSLYDSSLILSVVDGGRLNFDGTIIYNSYSDQGITKTGAGTAVLGDISGNNYNSGSVAADVQQGTLLVNNSQGNGLGAGSGIVKIEAGATLGGTGNIQQQVVSMDPTAVLTAGDPGQKSLGINPTIGTLTVSSVSATNGLTLAFKLDDQGTTAGTDNDLLTIGTLDLGGTVTIDFSTLNGFLQTGVPYFLATGSNWTAEQGLKFKFDLPNGYALAEDHLFTDGTSGGFDYDTEDGAMIVVFELAPEPSTYALVAFGLMGLIVIRRFRSRSV